MKKWGITGVLFLCLVLVFTISCTGGDETEGISQQLVDVAIDDFAIDVSGSGSIEAAQEARLSFGIGGRIEELSLKEGDAVKTGEVIASLETSALELAEVQAEVGLSQTELAKTQAEVALGQAELGLVQTEVALSQAELAQQTAEYELDTIKDSKEALELALLNAQINLDSAEYALSLAEETYKWPEVEDAEAEVEDAEAYLEYALAGLDNATTPAEIEMWSALVARSQISLAAAQARLDAIWRGYDKEEVAIKRLQVDAAEKAVAQAQKNIDDLTGQITLKEAQIALTKEALEQARLSIEPAQQSVKLALQSLEQTRQSAELAQNSLEEARRNLAKATVTAPFDGVVAGIFADEGDTISAINPIVYLIDNSSLMLGVDLDEIDIPEIREGQRAIITLDAIPDEELEGTVSSIYPVPVTVGGVVLYNIEIAFDAPEDINVKVGMSASADIIIAESLNALLVPSRAVSENSQGKTIVKVMKNEQIQERTVVTGLSNGLQTEIVSGLSEGETVVVEVRARSEASTSGFFQ